MKDKETVKYYKIYGYDSNFDLGGSHTQPLLCIVKAKDKARAEEYANTLSRYKDSWHGKGYVAEVKVVDLVGELNEIINQAKENEKNYYKKIVIPQERKETAEKIFAKLMEKCGFWYGRFVGIGKNDIIELAKQFGCEI